MKQINKYCFEDSSAWYLKAGAKLDTIQKFKFMIFLVVWMSKGLQLIFK